MRNEMRFWLKEPHRLVQRPRLSGLRWFRQLIFLPWSCTQEEVEEVEVLCVRVNRRGSSQLFCELPLSSLQYL